MYAQECIHLTDTWLVKVNGEDFLAIDMKRCIVLASHGAQDAGMIAYRIENILNAVRAHIGFGTPRDVCSRQNLNLKGFASQRMAVSDFAHTPVYWADEGFGGFSAVAIPQAIDETAQAVSADNHMTTVDLL